MSTFVTTRYYDCENKLIFAHRGNPRRMECFEKRSKNATRIVIEDRDYDLYNCSSTYYYFDKSDDGRWLGKIWKSKEGRYYRRVLTGKKTLMHFCLEEVKTKEAEKIISNEVNNLMERARIAISWCNQEYENDKDGRYWLGAYNGCGEYILIVDKNKKVIVGSVDNDKNAVKDCSKIAWNKALKSAIEEKIQGEYVMLKAFGSNAYFHLYRTEDEKYLTTKQYGFPNGYYSALVTKPQS